MGVEEKSNARRVQELRLFARDTPVLPILVQWDPDPDGMASAAGIRALLHRTDDASPIVSLGQVTRPENRRMAELLGIQVTQVTERELNTFRRLIAVDMQPQPATCRARLAVIDHHPPPPGYTADFVDIRPDVGAVATMVTQYLRASGSGISVALATGLLYGIRTDTDVLRRGTSGQDVEAYVFLQELADEDLLRRIGRPSFPQEAVTAVGQALTGLRRENGIAVAYLGRLAAGTAHVLPNLADFCLLIEGVSWSAAGGLLGDELAVNVRRSGGSGGGTGAGEVARSLAQEPGLGGGHHAMARVVFRPGVGYPLSDDPGDPATVEWLLRRVAGAVEALRAVR